MTTAMPAPTTANYRAALMAVAEEVYGPLSLPEMLRVHALLRQADEQEACRAAISATAG